MLPEPLSKVKILSPLDPQIKYDGDIDFEKFYSKVIKLLKKKKYSVKETKYKSKAGKQIEIRLEASRKELEYIKYKVSIKIFANIYKIKESKEEVVHKKIRVYVEITIKAEIEFDYDKRFKEKKFLHKLYWSINKGRITRRIVEFKAEMRSIIKEIQQLIETTK